MTGLAGTGQLSRLAFRRDCVVLPACVFGIAALLAITARDLKVLYPTAAGRLAVATRASANPALRFLLGGLNGTSVGAFPGKVLCFHKDTPRPDDWQPTPAQERAWKEAQQNPPAAHG